MLLAMKRSFFTFMFFAAVAAAFVSCSKEFDNGEQEIIENNGSDNGTPGDKEKEDPSNSGEGETQEGIPEGFVRLDFTARIESDAASEEESGDADPKGTIGPRMEGGMDTDGKFAWEDGTDEVKVLYIHEGKVEETTATASVEEDGTHFRPIVWEGTDVVWMIYPSSAPVSLNANTGNLTFTTFPGAQKITDGTNGFYFVAKGQALVGEGKAAFYHPFAYFAITIGGDGSDVTKAEITSAGDNIGASSAEISFGPSISVQPSEASATRTVLFDGEGDYLVPVLPGEIGANELSFRFYRTENEEYVPAGGYKHPKAVALNLASVQNWSNLPEKMTNRYVSPTGSKNGEPGTAGNGTDADNRWDMAKLAAFLSNSAGRDAETLQLFDGVRFHLEGGQYDITSMITCHKAAPIHINLIGSGSESTIFDGGESSRFMWIQKGDTAPVVYFEGMAFQNFKYSEDNGGTFKLDGVAKFKNCKFSHNEATTRGGGVANIWNGADATFDNCEFTNNKATGANGGGCFYIGSNSVATFNTCVFKGNSGTPSNCKGGVFTIRSGATVNCTGCTFGGAEEGEGNTAPGGGVFYVNANNASVIHVNISGGTATGNTATSSDGGFMCISGKSSTSEVVINDGMTISNNSAVYGGAISVASSGSLSIDGNVTISSNTASKGNKEEIEKNTNSKRYDADTQAAGGAIHVGGGTCKLQNVALEGNSAPNGSGGAIAHTGGTLTITQGVAFSDNQSYGAGGAIVSWSGFTAKGTSGSKVTFNRDKTLCTVSQSCSGGAVYVKGSTKTELEYVLFQNHDAGTESGSTVNYSNGGAIFINGDGFSASNCEFLGCRGRNGGAMGASPGSGKTYRFTDCYFHDNINRSGASKNGSVGNFHGGAAYMSGTGTLEFTNCRFEDNVSYHGAGACHMNTNGTVKFSGGTMLRNYTISGGGGCLMAEKGTYTVEGVNIEDNHITGANNGGVLMQLQEAVKSTFKDCTISGNYSNNGHGGCFEVDNGELIIDNCTVSGNYTATDKNGGVICMQSEATGVTVKGGSTFSGNRSGGNGGCIWASVGAVNLENSKFSGNYVTTGAKAYYGGVVYLDAKDASLAATGCTFSGNEIKKAAGSSTSPWGAVIRVQGDSKISLTDCVFENNKSVYAASCISLNSNGIAKINNCLFKGNQSASRGAVHGGANAIIYLNRVAFYDNSTTTSNGWGVNVHGGNCNICMNNVTSYNAHSTNSSPGNCVSFNSDGGWLITNSTFIDNTPTAVVRIGGGNNRKVTLCNNIIINRKTVNNVCNLPAASPYWEDLGHNILSCDASAHGNATAVDSDLKSYTEAGLATTSGDGFKEQWTGGSAGEGTYQYAYYQWTNGLSYTAATESDVISAMTGYSQTDGTHTSITSIGQDFKDWLDSLEPNGYQSDSRGVTRTGTMWPGSYQNN